MIMEMAVLDVVPGQEEAFEAAMKKAKTIICHAPGFHSLAVRRCIETTSRYLLLVEWNRLEDHTLRFRDSERYQAWRQLLHQFYDPYPVVQHYGESIFTSNSD